MRKLAASLLLPVVAAGTVAATATPAHAALPSNTIRKASPAGLTCSGSVVTKKVAYLNGKPAGVLTVYLNSRNTGTVYACFTHYGVTAGKKLPTSVTLVGTNTQSATKPVALTTSAIRTAKAAGPVALNHAKVIGHCFEAAGVVNVNGKNVTVTSGGYCWVRKYR